MNNIEFKKLYLMEMSKLEGIPINPQKHGISVKPECNSIDKRQSRRKSLWYDTKRERDITVSHIFDMPEFVTIEGVKIQKACLAEFLISKHGKKWQFPMWNWYPKMGGKTEWKLCSKNKAISLVGTAKSLIARGILPSLNEICEKHFITDEGVIQSNKYGSKPKFTAKGWEPSKFAKKASKKALRESLGKIFKKPETLH